METLNAYTVWLLNPYSGTVLFVIAIGYVVRAVPCIANGFIPLIGMVLGSLFFLCVAPLTLHPPGGDTGVSWNWYVLIWGVGLMLSAFAWLIHIVAITKLEDYIRSKSPALDAWFIKTSDQRDAGPDDGKSGGK